MAFTAVLVFASSLLAAAPAQYPRSVDLLPKPLSDRIDTIGREAVRVEHVPALTIAIVKNGRAVYAKGFGMRDLNSSTPADAVTRYEVGSNTKQFTAAAILLLKDQGKLSLDEQVSKWFPDYPGASSFTIRELLTHTAGLADFTQLPQMKSMALLPGSADRVLAMARTMPPTSRPGTEWQYSNTDYVMLAHIVELVSGEDFGAFLRSHFFDKLGMRCSGLFDFDDATSPDVAIGYTSFALGNYHRIPTYDPNWMLGAGDLSSNVFDLIKWNNALDNGRLLSATSTKEMQTPAVLPDGTNTGYGFGLFLGKMPNGHPYIKHGGAIPGFITEDARYPQDRLQIIVLSNSDQFVMGPVLSALYRAVTPGMPTATQTPAAIVKTQSAPMPIDELARAWLTGALAGSIDRTSLRADFDQMLSPDKAADLHALSIYGPIRSFTRTGSERRDPNTSYYYAVQTQRKKLIFMLTVDDAHKITNVIVTNGDPIVSLK